MGMGLRLNIITMVCIFNTDPIATGSQDQYISGVTMQAVIRMYTLLHTHSQHTGDVYLFGQTAQLVSVPKNKRQNRNRELHIIVVSSASVAFLARLKVVNINLASTPGEGRSINTEQTNYANKQTMK